MRGKSWPESTRLKFKQKIVLLVRLLINLTGKIIFG